MKHVLRIAMFAFFAAMATPAMADVVQNYDFSDVAQPFMNMPFNVTRVDTTGEYNMAKHIYHISDSFDNVIKKLKTTFEKGQKFGDFIPMGLSKQQSGEYQILFGYRNEHHLAMVRPEGNGCVIEVEAFPVSFISGIYDISIYGYSMPDGTVVSADKFVEE